MGLSIYELPEFPYPLDSDSIIAVSDSSTTDAYRADALDLASRSGCARLSAVRCRLSANFSVPNSLTWNTVPFAIKDFDHGNEWDTGTYTFNGATGIYYLSLNAAWANSGWAQDSMSEFRVTRASGQNYRDRKESSQIGLAGASSHQFSVIFKHDVPFSIEVRQTKGSAINLLSSYQTALHITKVG